MGRLGQLRRRRAEWRQDNAPVKAAKRRTVQEYETRAARVVPRITFLHPITDAPSAPHTLALKNMRRMREWLCVSVAHGNTPVKVYPEI